MKTELEESIKHAKSLMKEVPDSFHGGLEHSKKVVEISVEILKKEKDANKDVVIVSGWWHDTGRLYGNEGHEKRSAEFAYRDLMKWGLDEVFCRQVYLAIVHHRFDMKPTTLEGLIIRDADKLALLDPKRWQNAIKDKAYHKFEHTIHILPIIKSGILQRPISFEIYDKLLLSFLDYIESVQDEEFQNKKEEILALKLDKDLIKTN